jgi:cellulose synthase/poly-beta-1,6-N-acetylglucosamine synthase-like glycosyltransferase
VAEDWLDLAARRARESGATPLEELFALGFDRQRFWSLLATDLGLPFLSDLNGAELLSHPNTLATEAVRVACPVLVYLRGQRLMVCAPRGHEVPLLRRRLQAAPTLSDRIRIASPETIGALIAKHRHPALSHYAVNRLSCVIPRLSARWLGRVRNVSGSRALVAAALALILLAPAVMLKAFGILTTAFFLNCGLWKLAAALHLAERFHGRRLNDRSLPTYTVLVPLYRESAIVPDLVRHLKRLDYPAAKLQILMIVEADDGESRSAVARKADSGCFELIVVPPGGPRTKPKALTYALSFARGDLVTVFDAEDRPEPDQLRRAAAAFHERPELGCVQARLAPDNEGSWFARMFAVEYAANFEILLPALSDWDVPLPLGGTSNHFPRAVLEKVGAWDPFNVTEDADLGVRLARFGYPCATISAHTYEEAPVSFRQWLPQRRRWIKGWIQTAVLCARRAGVPLSLRLPIGQQLAVHGIITAGVVGLLLYPVSLLIIATAVIAAVNRSWPMDTFSRCLLALNFANLIAILIASAVSGYRGLKAAAALRLAWHIPLLPAYWALMSVAAWQALIRYFRNPAEWEKTAHGLARDRQPRGKKATERRDYRKPAFGQRR